jgi:hypothetical protein
MAKATKTATRTLTATGTMADAFKRWPTKLAGAKPSNEAVSTAASALKRHGTGKHLALAMYLRPEGATQPETVAACGDTNVNAYYDAVRGGHFKAVTLPTRNGHKVYALALPAKATRKPRKAAGKAKAAGKGKAAEAAMPATDGNAVS